MSIDFGKIVTNAVSALVTAVFVGAAVIVWDAATTIDSRIDAANDGLESANRRLEEQQSELIATQDTIVEQITENAAQLELLAKSVARLAPHALAGDDGSAAGEREPVRIDGRALEQWKLDERTRLKRGIDLQKIEGLRERVEPLGD